MTTGLLLLAALSISSPAFQQNGSIPPAFTCDGAGKNPELQIGGVPAAAKSLALIVFDPDVPKAIKSDGRYLHWALWNLATTSAVIEESRGGGLSEGGHSGWIPPCPPNGEHRYVFQAFALDTSLGETKITGEDDLRRAMDGHVLEQAELVGRYTGRISRFGTILLGLVLLVAVVLASRAIRRARAAGPAA